MTISIRPLRGGSWSFRPLLARAPYRLWSVPSNRNEYDGFRCALVVWRRQ